MTALGIVTDDPEPAEYPINNHKRFLKVVFHRLIPMTLLKILVLLMSFDMNDGDFTYIA